MITNLVDGYNVDNLEASFREFLIAQHSSPKTLKNYLSDFRHFFGWLFFTMRSDKTAQNANFQISVQQVNELIRVDMIIRYKEYLAANKIPNTTINRRLSTLRKFCSFCILQGWMSENPAKQVCNQTSLKKTSISSYDPSEQSNSDTDSILTKFKISLNTKRFNQSNTATIYEDVTEFFTIINS